MTERKKLFSKLRTIFYCVVFICLLLKCGSDIYEGHKMRNALNNGSKDTLTAIVINETHTLPNGHVSREYTYMYEFSLKGQVYKGICSEDSFKPGDKILIDYVITSPEYNCPHGYYGK